MTDIHFTVEYIQSEVKTILQKWGIKNANISACVTDDGSNMKKAFKDEFGAQKHLICASHKLNTVVRNSIEVCKDLRAILN